MKFSEATLKVLNNFSAINSNLLLSPGSTIRTISPSKTILASAEVEETIPNEAGIYDLNNFLAIVELMSSCYVSFEEDRFLFDSVDRVEGLQYAYSAKNMIISPPNKSIDVAGPSFTLEWDKLSKVVKAAGVLRVPDVNLVSSGGQITVSAVDVKNPTSNNFKLKVGECGEDFNMVIKVDNIKVLPMDYEVTVSEKGVIHFKGEKVEYWIAAEVI